MKRSRGWALGVGSVLYLWAFVSFGFAQETGSVTVKVMKGTCQIRVADGTKWTDLKPGMAVKPGDALLAGPDSSITVAYGDTCMVRMESITQMVLGDVVIDPTSKEKAPKSISVTLDSGTLLVALQQPEGGTVSMAIAGPTGEIQTDGTSSFIFQDAGSGEATVKVSEGEVQMWHLKFPDRITKVGAASHGTIKQDSPDGVVRSISIAERADLDRLEPLKKEVSPALADTKEKDEKGKKQIRIPQGHYGMMLARSMDLEKAILGHTHYPAISNLGSPRDVASLGGLEFTANMDDYLAALSARGIEPLDGWNNEALLTKGTMAVLLVRAYGIADEIPSESRGDELAYMQLLSDMGIVIEGGPDELVDKIVVINILTDPILVPPIGDSFFRGPSPTLPDYYRGARSG